MKKSYLIIGGVIVVLVLVGGYLGRHKIRALLSGPSSSVPTSQTTSNTLYGTTPVASPSATASGGVVSTKTGGPNGNYLVGSNGMTLYTFDKDTKGVNNCSGSCATTWPPYTTTAQSASMPTNLAVITRADGSMQYTWKGMPLYYFSGDTKSGDTNGDGINGVWHIAKP